MNDDTLLNKIEIMERCVARIHEEYDNKSDNLYLNITRQDSIILNLERACHAAIDAAMRVLRLKKLGLPKQLCIPMNVRGGEEFQSNAGGLPR